MMLENHTLSTLTKLAHQIAAQVLPLPQTTPLIMKEGYKVDRVDLKLLKEADKRNEK